MALRCEDCSLEPPELETLPSSRPSSITLRRISGVRLQIYAIIHFKITKYIMGSLRMVSKFK